jgi:hypothetical protein
MPGWGDAVGWIFDRLPSKKEGLRKRIEKLEREMDDIQRKQLTVILTALAISFSLVSCDKLRTPSKPSKDEIDFGKAGEQPTRIWQESDYLICNADKYRCVEK